MRTTPTHLAAAAVAAIVAVTGCGPATPAAGDSTTPEPAPPSVTEIAPAATETVMAPAPAAAPADAAVKASAAATAAVSSAYIGYVTNGFDALTATSWAADVTVSPPTAKGNGELLVDGQRAPTGFDVNGGRLRIENADGTREDVGAAFGVLDPPRILDPKTGLPALLSAAAAVDADTIPSDIRGVPMIQVRAQLPAEAGAILLPADSITETGPLPVTLWLDPNTQILRQLILTVGSGSVIVNLDPTSS
jgi:hypothetical protein